ncbi:MAG TPA: tetratricopeptide repeat protein [Vicinamibacteria bacterium]|nr:tetratricopeptide repeat protein [Vicinamibacteria bacterium]
MVRRALRPYLFVSVAALLLFAAAALWLPRRSQPIVVDYPLEGAVFPPEFPSPLVEWRDASPRARLWRIEVRLGAAEPPALHATSRGEPPVVGEIDPRAVGPTNELPRLTPERAKAHTWRPDAATWDAIKRGSTSRAAQLTITGYSDDAMRHAVSRGRVSIATSTDPVGAPIFYRDVPLMPSKGEKGVIKPLDQKFVPLIAWRLRSVAETGSRVMMTGLHSCANCHSVSRDGSTMGMDLDGPRNDKGLYALFPIRREAAIRNQDVIAWSTYRGKLGGKLRVAFMSQVSPNGERVVTTINDPGRGQTDYQRRQSPEDLYQNYYIANFTDYRFLQVFYPTRGILAWYSRKAGVLQPLPGADDPRFVHANAVWSPDGSYLVFARAEAKDAYPGGSQLAERANDPRETQVRYDLYRIPFNDGRGGKAEPIAGASGNGMSNSFPKVSPDGRFIVFVQARNGQLMRPDGQLYIVPAAGGAARRMRCNTPLMNSWHSFSPNGRWLVFSSKSRSPYTQMFLTHLDEQGDDTPAVMIENSTAANRAVNIPEFVNIPPDGLQRIDTPVVEYYRLIDVASDAMNQGRHAEAIPLFQQALARDPGDAMVHNSYGSALAATGRLSEATAEYRRATALSPDYPDAHNNLASALVQQGDRAAATLEFEKALSLKPDFPEAHAGLGGVLAQAGRLPEAIVHLQRAVELSPDNGGLRTNLSLALSLAGRPAEAIQHAEQAVALSKGQNPLVLDLLGRLYAQAGRLDDAVATTRRAIDVATQANDPRLVRQMEARLASYEAAAGGSGGR